MNRQIKQFAQQPIFFERNRVFRVYEGGYLFADLLGDEQKDANYPEEWIASTVKALNANSTDEAEGLSILEGTDITLKQLIEEYPEEVIGEKKEFGILVKYLDSAIRLPLQAHPDRAFSEAYFQSSYGKTEMWLVLATRKNATICFGFREKMTKQEFSQLIEQSKEEKGVMEGYLNCIPVNPGDVFLIPAKAVHAIGKGCCILEVQEPTDFTIQPEYWCGDYMLNEAEMYLGLKKEKAIECFDFEVYGKDCIQKARKLPQMVLENLQFKKECLIGAENTPCFSVNRYIVRKKMKLAEGPAVYIVTKGKGQVTGEGYKREIGRGSYFMMPQNAAGKFAVSTLRQEALELVECLPPV